MLGKLLLAGVAAVTLVGPVHAAVVVGDASFEDLGFPNGYYQYNPTGSAWAFTGNSGETGNNSAWGFADAPNGNVVAFLQGVASISQTISGLVAGKSYEVSFDLSRRPNYGYNPVTASFNGTTLAGSDTSAPTAFSWQSFTGRFTATGTTGLLAFSTVNGAGDNDSGLDNVRVAAVPEAATWGMMLAGFGMMGVALRSRRRSAVSFG